MIVTGSVLLCLSYLQRCGPGCLRYAVVLLYSLKASENRKTGTSRMTALWLHGTRCSIFRNIQLHQRIPKLLPGAVASADGGPDEAPLLDLPPPLLLSLMPKAGGLGLRMFAAKALGS